jgi:hypothetical protein
MQVITTPQNPTTLAVRIVAGRGLVQKIEIREARNASINIGGQTVNRDTHVYTPAPAAAESTFVVSQLVAGQPTMVQIVAVDDCGPWPTFVGSGPAGFR